MRKNIFKYLAELLIVCFGVFLGMYISEWNSEKHKRENTSKSLNYMIKELESNCEALAYSIEYHDTLKSNLMLTTKELMYEDLEKAYLGRQGFHVTDIKNWTGVHLPKFELISYEGAKINGVFQELDFEVVQLIASAYKQISFNQELGKTVMDKLLQSNSSTKVIDIIGAVELLTTDVLYDEYRLMVELKKTIQKLKEYEL